MESGRDYVGIARRYQADVLSGKQVACKWVKLACQRNADDLKRKTSAKWPYWWSDWWANDVCGFVEKLPHVEGQWATPTITLEAWQIFILSSIFGWRRVLGDKPDEGTDPRRFNTAYLEVARKNAKSTLTAGVGLYCLTCEGENGPLVVSAATTNQQARKVWKPAHDMVERTPDLREAFQLEAMAHAIPCWSNGGTFQPIHSKASTQDGWNPHAALIDELHAHKDRSLFDVLKSARGARTNPLSWYITTAGYSTVGVCYEQRTLVTKILQGVIEAEHYFGIVFTLDEEDRDDSKGRPAWIDNEGCWVKANPNLGVSVDLNELRGYVKEAVASPASMGECLTKRFNVWLHAAANWLDVNKWARLGNPGMKPDDFAGAPCWIAGDLSDNDDITALTLMFWPEDGEPKFFHRFYLPEELVKEKAVTVGAHYAVWAQAGDLILTPGDFIDRRRIEADIRAWADAYGAKEIALDQFGSSQLVSNLGEDGYTATIVHKCARNYTDPAKDYESRIKRGKMAHDASPPMKWMVSNVCAEIRTDKSLLPKKEDKNSPNKIDGVDTDLMCLGRALLWLKGESVYESRGILVA